MFSNWTYIHVITLIPALVIFVVFAIALGLWLKKYDENVRLIPIHFITVLLVALELIKQVKSLIAGYQLTKLPLYYCSLFLVLYVLTSLYRGKHKDCIRVLTVTSGITLLATMLIMPDLIYSNNAVKNMFNDFDDFHTVVYHNLVLLGTMLMMTLGFCKIKVKRDYLVSTIFYTAYCWVAAPFANLLGMNYNNFQSNSIGFVENIRLWLIDNIGYFFGQSMYVLLATFTTVGFSLIMYTVMVVVKKVTHKEWVAQETVEEEEKENFES